MCTMWDLYTKCNLNPAHLSKVCNRVKMYNSHKGWSLWDS